MTWLAIFVPSLFVVIALTLVELRCGRDGGDWRINLQNWAINLVAGVTVYGMFTVWHGPALIDGASLPFWLAVPIYVVVQDLGEYLFHRAQHAIPLLWTMHSLHHSDPDMSALTSTRHFWGDRLIKSFCQRRSKSRPFGGVKPGHRVTCRGEWREGVARGALPPAFA